MAKPKSFAINNWAGGKLLILGSGSVTTITGSPDKGLKSLVQMWANFRRAVLVV